MDWEWAVAIACVVLLLGIIFYQGFRRGYEGKENPPGTWQRMTTNDKVIMTGLVVVFLPAGLWYYQKRSAEMADQNPPTH